jgi:hypothetical protein
MDKKRLQPILDIWSESENYEWAQDPFSKFLDLIGYSEEYFGETIASPKAVYGYRELWRIGEALVEYSDRPQDVEDLITKLISEEVEAD